MQSVPRSPCFPTRNSLTTSFTVRGCSASSTSASTCNNGSAIDSFQSHGECSPERFALQAHRDVRRVVGVPDLHTRFARAALGFHAYRIECARIGLDRFTTLN